MLIYLVVCLFIGAVVAAWLFLLIVFVHLTVANQRLKPTLTAIVVATLTGVVTFFFNYPPAMITRYLVLPIVCPALATAISLTRSDWNLIVTSPAIVPVKRWRDTLMIVCGAICATAGVATGVGRPILLALNYDVLGSTQAELIDIGIAGAIFGFLAGATMSLLLWTTFVRFFR